MNSESDPSLRPELSRQEDYWRRTLGGELPVLHLCPDHPRPPVCSFIRASENIDLPSDICGEIRDLCARQNVTGFVMLLAAFKTLLFRHSGLDDIIVGSVSSDSILQKERQEKFTNPVALRTGLEGDPPFARFLKRVARTVEDASKNRDWPFERIVEDIQKESRLSDSSVFQVMFVAVDSLSSVSAEPISEENLVSIGEYVAECDLVFLVSEQKEAFTVACEYDAELFNSATIDRFLRQYQTLLAGIVARPDQQISGLPILTELETHQLLIEWNDTDKDYPSDKRIHELFEEQVERTPDSVAVVFEGQELTYRELNRRSNQLAHYLIGLGVGPEVLVGICLERSVKMVVAVLGVLKSGGAYVPLDPSYPKERLRFMLEDAQATAILTEDPLAESFLGLSARVICSDRYLEEIAQQSEKNPATEAKPDNLAYVIFTSGSTGRPKGVQVPHRTAMNLLSDVRERLRLSDQDTSLFVASLSFDISVMELFLPLSVGARIVVVSSEVAADGPRLIDQLSKSRATVMHATPATWRLLNQAGWQGRVPMILCGGEALQPELAAQLKTRGISLWNLYGPTETTIYSSAALYQSEFCGGKVPIGRPIANTRIYLLDADLQPVPIGVAGELYIGGAGVARGYLNRSEITAEKFIPDLYSVESGARLYRTGDLACFLPDGNIEYLGRIDHQVKIRGFRIELGEIESVLSQHPAVLDNVVIAREDTSGENRLVAYVITRHQASLTISALRGFLKEKLPDYMLPSQFVFLDSFPLTPNGKLDRAALPQPDQTRPELMVGFVAPRTPVEELLAEIWAKLLNLERVGVHDNFFELGGHSLLATQVISRLRHAFQMELPLRSLFEGPTVADLAERVEASDGGKAGLQVLPILPASRDGDLPLSFAQQRLWFLDQYEPNSSVYNISSAQRLQGPLDVAALEQSLDEIARRHETLRATFSVREGQPVQIISRSLSLPLPVVDLGDQPETDKEADVRRLTQEEKRRPFDLERGPLVRSILLRLGSNDHVILLTVHHIAADGWSMEVFFDELSLLYEAISQGKPSPLPDLPIQYADYAVWQREWLQGEVLETQLSYWKNQLANVQTLQLPTDRPRPPVQRYWGASQSMLLSGELQEALKTLSRQQGVTLFMTLLAAFQTLLHRYTGQDDIAVGSPIAGRNRSEIEGLVGFFVNTLVLRGDLSGDPSFRELLGRVRKVALDAYAHQDLPFEKLVEELQPQRNLSHSPLFQVMFVFQNAPATSLEIQGLIVSSIDSRSDTAKFDLILSIREESGSLRGDLQYNTDLFDGPTVKRMLGHFENLLKEIVADPDRRLSDFPLLTQLERHQLLVEWNNTKREHPEDKCVHQLFEEQVERTPDAIAVVFESQELTYRELNQRANQLAHYLIRLGVGPEQLVGIVMERSLEMVVAVLGILKSGGAYVPMDHDSPKERLSFLLQDTKASALVTQGPRVERLPSGAAQPVCLDPCWTTIRQERIENPTVGATPTRLAYVTYTSGSTGQPKGVMIEHRSLVNYLHWVNSGLLNDHIGTVPMITDLTFDACLKQLFAPLLCGKQVWLVPRDLVMQPAALLQEIRRKDRVGLNCVPSVWAAMLNEIDSVQAMPLERTLTSLFLGGERFGEELIGKSFAAIPALEIRNLYGPTETTANASCGKVVSSDKVTIGKPIANTEIFLLDSRLQPVPIGVVGEIYIGGAGLARGYLNRPELTAEKFIASPFGSLPGARLYRTGDLARYLSDGNIEFLGRVDQQVKIRGFRIELGEIESTLRQHPSVHEAIVLARGGDHDEDRLVAYIVSNQQPAPSTHDLRSFLKQKLPDYMLPAIILFLDSVPLLPNGKVNRRALPSPDQSRPELKEQYVPPRTPVEELFAGIWAELLKLERVGIHDNFFELGGHSLLAMQVIGRLRSAQIELPLRALFESPTIAGLAKDIAASQSTTQKVTSLSIPTSSRDGDLPVSFAQARLWFLDQLEPNSSLYNLANGIRLKGPLNVGALERSLNEIVRRHEALRTRFSMVQGQPIQVISPSLILSLPVSDFTRLSPAEREAAAEHLADEESQRPFDLAREPLLRSRLARLGDDDHLLLVTMHHIVSDGWSMGIFFRELSILYEAFSNGKPSPLPDLPIQYADYAVWQRHWLEGEELDRQFVYWNRQLAGAPAVLLLPADRPRPPIQKFKGANHPISIPKPISEALKALSHHEGATLFMTLLAAFKVLLSRYTGETDIVVGAPIAGRTHSKSEDLIGFFANTLVLRTDTSGDPTFRALLQRVKKIALEAYAHQELPFEKLVEFLQPERALSYNPLFQILFALNNTRTPVLELPGLTVSHMELERETARFDLALDLYESRAGLSGLLEYNTDLFDAATITRMAGHFETLLKTIASDPNQRVSTLPLLTEAERRKLLVQWNGTPINQRHDLCLNEMFEAQVERAPESVAVVCAGNRLTYHELNRRANRLAHFLTKVGVEPEVPVGICVERSVDMLVGLLAILKAGGAYVPLDPAYPAERLAFMLDEIQTPVLLTQQHILEKLPRQQSKVICLDADWEIIAEESEENLSIPITPENLAYVIYTSGSTGRPKGIQICHRSVFRLLEATRPLFGFDERDVWTVFHSYAFDFSVWEIWGALLQGSRLVVVPLQVTQSPAAFHDLLRSERVTILNQTPSAMRQLVEANPNGPKNVDYLKLRLIICGGETFPSDLASASMEWGVPVWNFYGPTEATVWATINPVTASGSEGESIPIGRPIADRQIYLLDENLQPVPVGIPGELHIGGAGLARGYFKRPELTAERFIPCPFSNDPGVRLYRTGDLARYLPDGEIEFLGRIDQQIKIRGFRVELGEVESVLGRHPSVQETVVTAFEESGREKELVAYVISKQDPTATIHELRSFLKKKLSDYMIPSAFVFLDSLPLTSNGKINRGALPAPDRSRARWQTYVAPRTPVEEKLAAIWGAVLRLERVGIHDNFFDLGGHSLKATQVISQLREVFQVEMPLRNLFEHPTVAGLARSLEAMCRSSNGPWRNVHTTTVRETGKI